MTRYRERIPGGRAAGMSPKDFAKTSLAAGIEVEMEHTTSRAIAREIAMDHLAEDPHYYLKLALIEAHPPKAKRKSRKKAKR